LFYLNFFVLFVTFVVKDFALMASLSTFIRMNLEY